MGKRIFVTGGTGFVGRYLVPHLKSRGYDVSSCGRPGKDLVIDGFDAVVHLAGIAHRVATESEYEAVNDTTAELISKSRESGVSHFVLMSSIAAQSNAISAEALTEDSRPNPVSAYGKAKLAAEKLVSDSGIPFTILRPVAIVGEGAKGNPGLLQMLARLPVPVPLGRVRAKRSIVAIEQVVSAVSTVLFNKDAFDHTFIVADPEPKSAAEIISNYRRKAGKNSNIINFPPSLLKAAFIAVGRREMWDRIDGQLIASPCKLMSIGWSPYGPI